MIFLTYSQFYINFSTHFEDAANGKTGIIITRQKSGDFMLRAQHSEESLAGVRKVTGAQNTIKKQLPAIFDSIAASNTKRAFVIGEQIAVLEKYSEPA